MNRFFGFFLVVAVFFQIGFANIGPQGFGAFPNEYFVETGSLGGDGIRTALRARAFREIYSMDMEPRFIAYCGDRFKDFPNVHLVLGDSGADLWNVISKIDRPITFWLDAHNGTGDLVNGSNTPILKELEQIKWHPIKTHTILIDDMHCCGTVLFDYLTREDLIQKLKEINPDYVIEYVPGGDDGEYPENVMVARV